MYYLQRRRMAGKDIILVTGSSGQVGEELCSELKKKYGSDQVIASDIKKPALPPEGHFEILDVLNSDLLNEIIGQYQVTQIYHLAGLLSAKAEKQPMFSWELNMGGLQRVLDASVRHKVKKVFWPSSIAVFGPNTPKDNTPQHTIMEPNTIYGMTKLAGERWVEYYYRRYNLDIRSMRYPGLIGYKSLPGGGTTDYAVDIFYNALQYNDFECFLEEHTILPMMYMPDAVRATLELMEADGTKLTIRSSYNIAGFSIAPGELASEIKKHLPKFNISYKPDYRQTIAESWPKSIDDSIARDNWNWKPSYDLAAMTKDMLTNIKLKETI